MSLSLLQFIAAAVFIIPGVVIMILETFGIFHIKYVLNRMHAAAMGDSLGILLIACGVMICFGLSFATLKILCIVLLFWVAAPTCSHLVTGFEVFTNDHLEDECELPEEAERIVKGGTEGMDGDGR